MELVINISEEDIEAIKYLKEKGFASRHEIAILNGTPLPKGHGWINVNDKLPSGDEGVLITKSDGDVTIGGFTDKGWWECEAWKGFEWIDNVIAWQSLPKPYVVKADKGEE